MVTLAAAFVIPEETEHREVLLLIAFTVVAGTLFVQGLSLPWVARTLRVPSPDPLDDALARASVLQQASKAGFKELERMETDDPHGVLDQIRQRVEQRNFAAWERLSTTAGQESPSDLYARVRLAMIGAERQRVLEIRSSGTVASDVIRDVLAVLDVEESMLDVAVGDEDERDEARNARVLRGDTCDHLDETPARPPATVEDGLVCEQCVEAGVHWVSLRRCLTCGARRLLRLLALPARHRALPRDHAPGHAVGPARRGLALVLRAPPHRLSRAAHGGACGVRRAPRRGASGNAVARARPPVSQGVGNETVATLVRPDPFPDRIV